jgi:hypothetical protein
MNRFSAIVLIQYLNQKKSAKTAHANFCAQYAPYTAADPTGSKCAKIPARNTLPDGAK